MTRESKPPESAWPPRRDGPKCIIGMVHLLPLPGARDGCDLAAVIAQASADLTALQAGGVDAVLVQNRGDRIVPNEAAPPDTVAAMGAVLHSLVSRADVPLGVHVLRNDVLASVAIARVAGARFIRAAVLTGVSDSAQGMLQGRPHEVDRYRRGIGAEGVLVLADIASMHNHTPVDSVAETAHDAVFFGGADAVIVADPSVAAARSLVQAVREAVDVPVLIGGYARDENLGELGVADGFIVGSAFERTARQAGVDPERVSRFVTQAHLATPR